MPASTGLHVDFYSTLVDIYSFSICDSRIDARLINEFGYLGRCHRNHTANRSSANTYSAHNQLALRRAHSSYDFARAGASDEFGFCFWRESPDCVFVLQCTTLISRLHVLKIDGVRLNVISWTWSPFDRIAQVFKSMCTSSALLAHRPLVIDMHSLYVRRNQLTNVLHSLDGSVVFCDSAPPIAITIAVWAEFEEKNTSRIDSSHDPMEMFARNSIWPERTPLRTAYEVPFQVGRANTVVFQFVCWNYPAITLHGNLNVCVRADGQFIWYFHSTHSLREYNFPQ